MDSGRPTRAVLPIQVSIMKCAKSKVRGNGIVVSIVSIGATKMVFTTSHGDSLTSCLGRRVWPLGRGEVCYRDTGVVSSIEWTSFQLVYLKSGRAEIRDLATKLFAGDLPCPRGEVSSSSLQYNILTEDGRILNGILASETPASILRSSSGIFC